MRSNNVWDIAEYEGDGRTCPITPRHLPLQKRILLFFFRFGLCPMCVTMSLAYSVRQAIRK